MSENLSEWLALREPTDHAARSESLTRHIAAVAGCGGPLSVLDLATGTGSNLRFLVARLGGVQRWLVVDRDAALLNELPERTGSWGGRHRLETIQHDAGFTVEGAGLACRVETRQVDLDRLDEEAMFAGRQLVTASALLDLVSERWLRTLAARCRSAGAAVLVALTYDGRSSCSPAEPEDQAVRALLNEHQERDKGLGGPAAGPAATAAAERCFANEGYLVRREPSEWVLGVDDRELQRELIEGWARAASETDANRGAAIAEWKERRLAHVRAGRSRLIVGHEDLAAWLPGR